MAGQDLDLFLENSEKQDAVIRNLEIIGEAAGKVPDTVKENCRNVEWRKIVGLRNILIHEYFGVRDVEIADIPFFLVGCAVRTLLELSLYLVSGNSRAHGAPY